MARELPEAFGFGRGGRRFPELGKKIQEHESVVLSALDHTVSVGYTGCTSGSQSEALDADAARQLQSSTDSSVCWSVDLRK